MDTDTDDEYSTTFVIHPADLCNVPKKFRVLPELAIGEAIS